MAERVPLRWTSIWPRPPEQCGRCGVEGRVCGVAFGTTPEGEAHMVALCYACTVYVSNRIRITSEPPLGPPN